MGYGWDGGQRRRNLCNRTGERCYPRNPDWLDAGCARRRARRQADLCGRIGEAIGPDVDRVHHESVGPGVEFVGSDEEMKGAYRDALNGQPATAAVARQRIPDIVARQKRESRRQIMPPEKLGPGGTELASDILLERCSNPNRSAHPPRAPKRRRSSSSRRTRLIVSGDNCASGTTRSPSAWRSMSSTLGAAGRGLPSRSTAWGVVGVAMVTRVVGANDNERRPRPGTVGAPRRATPNPHQ